MGRGAEKEDDQGPPTKTGDAGEECMEVGRQRGGEEGHARMWAQVGLTPGLPPWGILRCQEGCARPGMEDWLCWPRLVGALAAGPEVSGWAGVGLGDPGGPTIASEAHLPHLHWPCPGPQLCPPVPSLLGTWTSQVETACLNPARGSWIGGGGGTTAVVVACAG